jgi:hypothetical protein
MDIARASHEDRAISSRNVRPLREGKRRCYT